MTSDQSAKKCASTCWYVAVGLGLLLAIVLIAASGWSLLWAMLLGVLVFFFLGFVLPQLVCTSGAVRPLAATSAPSSLVAGDPPAPQPGGAHAAAASAAAATPPHFDEPDEAAPQAHPVASEARKPKADSDAASTDESEKPETLSAPRKGGADDLKLIKGVGPKLEKMLNGMGFYHYEQIANWTDAQVAWVDQNLQGFKGRATRDDWTGQAATLASGGTTEFASRAGKNGAA
ncbi:hypothetical protein ACEWPL_008945 [Roseovarius sp. S1116L3]|uniref:hypothetical protein n=1 Tax=Roseovarius roseus TaxID=3342636 RepID=UPI003B683EA8